MRERQLSWLQLNFSTCLLWCDTASSSLEHSCMFISLNPKFCRLNPAQVLWPWVPATGCEDFFANSCVVSPNPFTCAVTPAAMELSLPGAKGGRAVNSCRVWRDVLLLQRFSSALSSSAEDTSLPWAQWKWDTKVCGQIGEKGGKSKSSKAKPVVTLAKSMFCLTLMLPFPWIRQCLRDGITA